MASQGTLVMVMEPCVIWSVRVNALGPLNTYVSVAPDGFATTWDV